MMTVKLVIALAVSVLALANVASADKELTQGTGKTPTGYFYSFWSDNKPGSSVRMWSVGNGADYKITWNQINNIVGGTGWQTGSRKTITFSATYQPNGNSYLALYGWTHNPLIEYYIVESWGSWRPTAGDYKGTVSADGGTYDIYQSQRQNAPSVEGNGKTFFQFWSVRKEKRTSGTITVSKHFDAWSSKGMNLGNRFDYMIMATEGYQSSGSASVHLTD